MSNCHLLLAGAIESFETGHDPPEEASGDQDLATSILISCVNSTTAQLEPICASEIPGCGDNVDIAHVFYNLATAEPVAADYMKIDDVLATNSSITKPGQLILDSAAGVTVINELSCAKLESYIPIANGVAGIAGVGGNKTPTKAFVNLKEPFGSTVAHYVPGSVANILSQPDVQETYYTTFKDQKTPLDRVVISLEPDGYEEVAIARKDFASRFYMFDYTSHKETSVDTSRGEEPLPKTTSKSDKLWTYSEAPMGSATDDPHVLNVFRDAYSKGMSKNQIERALKAKKAHRAYSYISLKRLKELLRTHRFGFDIGPDDVAAYERIHDEDCLSCLLGKTTRSDQVTLDVSKATKPGERIICDILEIKSKKLKTNVMVLISVDEYSAYTHTRYLAKKDLKNVTEAFKYIVDDYKSFGWQVKEILLDNDGAFRELGSHLTIPLGVDVIPTSPDKHAVVAERMIRTLTTLFRCTLAGLPYVLAPHLFANLLDYCASSNNLVPNVHNPMISPTELFTGRSPEHHKLCNIEYGKLVTFYNPTKQNDEFRAKVGIIIGRDVRRPGHAIIWDLINGGALPRNDFKTLEWNQALLKAYIDAAMASHESNGVDVPRAVYYDASDITLSGDDVSKLVEDPNATIASIRGGAPDLGEKDDNPGPDIWENKLAMQRLRDISNASAQKLFISDDVDRSPDQYADADMLECGDEMEEPADDINLPKNSPNARAASTAKPRYHKSHQEYLAYKRARDMDPSARSCEDPRSCWANMPPTRADNVKAWAKQAKENLDAGYILPSRTRSGKTGNIAVLNLSVKQASEKISRAETIKALLSEFNQMGDKKVWVPTTREELKELYRLGKVKNVLPCSVFLKEKYDADKNFLKLKARLVVHGNRQIIDELFGAKDIDSPTASLASINILLHMAAAGGWHKRVVDVAGAYLNADLKEPEFMRIPRNVIDIIKAEFERNGQQGEFDQFLQDDGSIVVELKKALYGLRQSGRAWYELLSDFLIENGFIRSEVDKCLFSKTVGEKITHVAVYVDDLLMVGNNEAEIESLTEKLRGRFKEITVQEGKNISFVGMEIHTADNGDIQLRQRGYIVDVLQHFGVAEQEHEPYPCSGNIMGAPKAEEDNYDVSKFKSGVMKLMYLSTRTRPDIAFAVSALASRAENPKTSDWDRLVHIARFLNGTKDDFLTYKYGGTVDVSAFVDASFMTHRDMRSHTGYCIFADKVGGAAIVYRSVKQKTVADSSTEAEVIALHELVQHLLWVISIYDSLNVHIHKPVAVHNDNEAAIRLNSQEKVNFKGRSKYIARKFFSIFEHIEDGTLQLIWTGTDDLVADFLTKAIIGGKFSKFRIKMGFSSSTTPTANSF